MADEYFSIDELQAKCALRQVDITVDVYGDKKLRISEISGLAFSHIENESSKNGKHRGSLWIEAASVTPKLSYDEAETLRAGNWAGYNALLEEVYILNRVLKRPGVTGMAGKFREGDGKGPGSATGSGAPVAGATDSPGVEAVADVGHA